MSEIVDSKADIEYKAKKRQLALKVERICGRVPDGFGDIVEILLRDDIRPSFMDLAAQYEKVTEERNSKTAYERNMTLKRKALVPVMGENHAFGMRDKDVDRFYKLL